MLRILSGLQIFTMSELSTTDAVRDSVQHAIHRSFRGRSSAMRSVGRFKRARVLLVAAYGFGEGSGTTVADTSGNANSGTIAGASWSPTGKFGTALSFNGTSDW